MQNDSPKAKIAITGVFIQGDDNSYMAYLAEIPEVASEGLTVEEATRNLFELLPDVLEVKSEIADEQRIIHGHDGGHITKTFEFQQV